MKIKLKDGVSASDIPRFSGVYKRMASMLSNNSVVEFNEGLPKGWENYAEEVNSPTKKETNKNKEAARDNLERSGGSGIGVPFYNKGGVVPKTGPGIIHKDEIFLPTDYSSSIPSSSITPLEFFNSNELCHVWN